MEEQAENHLWETDKDNSCCFEKCYRPKPNVNASRSMHGTEGKRTEGPQHNISYGYLIHFLGAIMFTIRLPEHRQDCIIFDN